MIEGTEHAGIFFLGQNRDLWPLVMVLNLYYTVLISMKILKTGD